MTKSFTKTPAPIQALEAFAQSGPGPDRPSDEPTKRLSIDLPVSLHTAFKLACTANGTAMTTELMLAIRRYIETHKPA